MRVRSLGSLAVGLVMLPALLCSIELGAQSQPAPTMPVRDRPASDMPTGTGRLRGRVTSETSTPLRRAQVRVSNAAFRLSRMTTTDADGRYEVVDLPPGRYSISVSKAGYVALEFGQTRPFEGGRPFELAEGQVGEQIDFALPRGGVITGRITDDSGEPVIGAYVQALRYQYLPGGRRQLTSTGANYFSNMTNDLGQFRLFGLMPGTYVVSALATNTGVVSLTQGMPGTGGVGSIDARDGFIQTYHPGTANVAEAQPVMVSLSDEAQASFSLVVARMSRVSGIVRRSDGRPASDSQVFLRPIDGETAMGGGGMSGVAPDGSFSLANVPPGQFLLEAAPSRQMYGGDAQPGAAFEFGSVAVTVGASDVTGLSIVTKPGVTVSGRIVLPGRSTKNSDGTPIRVAANPADPSRGPRMSMMFTPNNGVTDDSGRFQIRGVVGQVLFRPMISPPNLVLKSVTLNGVDITDRPYDTNNGDAVDLEIIVAEQAQVNGTARNARGDLVKDFKVALYPAAAQPGVLMMRFMHSATADPTGRFLINRLPAGEYVGVAVESFERGAEWDPAFQRRVLPGAKRFAIKEGQTLTLELPYVE